MPVAGGFLHSGTVTDDVAYRSPPGVRAFSGRTIPTVKPRPRQTEGASFVTHTLPSARVHATNRSNSSPGGGHASAEVETAASDMVQACMAS